MSVIINRLICLTQTFDAQNVVILVREMRHKSTTKLISPHDLVRAHSGQHDVLCLPLTYDYKPTNIGQVSLQ